LARGTPPALVKGSRAPSMRSHALCFLLIHALHALCTADIHPLFMVRSLQLVEVRPYAEEEEEDHILTKNENHLTMQQRTI